MPSFLTINNIKISMKHFGNNIYLLTIVDQNGNASSVELSFENITVLSAIINSLVMESDGTY
jgi:hypothetical protein